MERGCGGDRVLFVDIYCSVLVMVVVVLLLLKVVMLVSYGVMVLGLVFSQVIVVFEGELLLFRIRFIMLFFIGSENLRFCRNFLILGYLFI